MLEQELVRRATRLRRQVDSLVKPEVPRKGGVAVFNNAAIPVGTGAWQALTFNSERWDDAGFHAPAPNPSRLTVPVGYAGRYIISGHFVFVNSGAGTHRAGRIYLNNATAVALTMVPFNAAAWSYLSIATIYNLAAGDFVELCAYQDTGGNLNVVTGGNYSPEFRMERVG